MQQVILTRGLPASGKSTYARHLVETDETFKRVNRDELRLMLYQGQWSDEKETVVLEIREAILFILLIGGHNVVIDDTHLNPKRLNETIKTLKEIEKDIPTELDIRIKDFLDVPLDTCISRNALRPDETRVPESLIRDYYERYVKQLLRMKSQNSIPDAQSV